MEDCEEGGSSSSVVYALRFRETGVLGFDGGGVGRIALSGTTLYNPSFDLKSCMSVSSTIDPAVSWRTYGYSTTGTYASACDEKLFVRFGKGVGDILKSSIITSSNFAKRHTEKFCMKSCNEQVLSCCKKMRRQEEYLVGCIVECEICSIASTS